MQGAACTGTEQPGRGELHRQRRATDKGDRGDHSGRAGGTHRGCLVSCPRPAAWSSSGTPLLSSHRLMLKAFSTASHDQDQLPSQPQVEDLSVCNIPCCPDSCGWPSSVAAALSNPGFALVTNCLVLGMLIPAMSMQNSHCACDQVSSSSRIFKLQDIPCMNDHGPCADLHGQLSCQDCKTS